MDSNGGTMVYKATTTDPLFKNKFNKFWLEQKRLLLIERKRKD